MTVALLKSWLQALRVGLEQGRDRLQLSHVCRLASPNNVCSLWGCALVLCLHSLLGCPQPQTGLLARPLRWWEALFVADGHLFRRAAFADVISMRMGLRPEQLA